MGTIIDKLTAVLNSKAAIKQSIEAKGVSVGDVPFNEYSQKIDSIQSTPDIISDLPKFIEGELLKALDDNATEGYICGNIYLFSAGEENNIFIREGWIYNTKWIYSDGSSYEASHAHAFDTSKDILTAYGKYRYRINLHRQTQHLFFEIPRPTYNGNVNFSRGLSHVLGKNLRIDTATIEMSDLNYIRIIDCVENPNTYNFMFKGNDPNYLIGINYKNSNLFFGSSTTNFEEISNIGMNVEFNLFNYGMTKKSILHLLNALIPITDGSTKTVKLGGAGNNLKMLAPEEIAIATNKGWIVTN